MYVKKKNCEESFVFIRRISEKNISRLDLSLLISNDAYARYGPYESIMCALGRINDTGGERVKTRVKRRALVSRRGE